MTCVKCCVIDVRFKPRFHETFTDFSKKFVAIQAKRHDNIHKLCIGWNKTKYTAREPKQCERVGSQCTRYKLQ